VWCRETAHPGAELVAQSSLGLVEMESKNLVQHEVTIGLTAKRGHCFCEDTEAVAHQFHRRPATAWPLWDKQCWGAPSTDGFFYPPGALSLHPLNQAAFCGLKGCYFQ